MNLKWFFSFSLHIVVTAIALESEELFFGFWQRYPIIIVVNVKRLMCGLGVTIRHIRPVTQEKTAPIFLWTFVLNEALGPADFFNKLTRTVIGNVC